jgi:hypothetical protein
MSEKTVELGGTVTLPATELDNARRKHARRWYVAIGIATKRFLNQMQEIIDEATSSELI